MNEMMFPFIMDIIYGSISAGNQFSKKNTCNSSQTGISKSQRNKQRRQKINRQDANGLFQYLRNGRDKRRLHAQKESADTGANGHERDCKGK